LLKEPGIDAVDVVVPIDSLLTVIEQALEAGKHVISEKPLSPDVASVRKNALALQMVSKKKKQTNKQLNEWMCGEKLGLEVD
jgi:predicted dehydrogenase